MLSFWFCHFLCGATLIDENSLRNKNNQLIILTGLLHFVTNDAYRRGNACVAPTHVICRCLMSIINTRNDVARHPEGVQRG
jgi:hypothetical protein